MNSGGSGSSDEEDEGSQSSEDSKALSSNLRKQQYDDSDVQIFEHNEKTILFLSVSVSDTGIGMNEEMKKKCFLLFGNLKFKQDINQGGMGLGLASANLICKSLNGELNLIRSEENEGSKFQFTMAIEKICTETISS
jgi:signal transduction histidine kinase